MTISNEILNKLNELKSTFVEMKNEFPVGFEESRDRLSAIIDFATERVGSKWHVLQNDAEQTNLINVINVIISYLTNFMNSKNPAYINHVINSAADLKNQLNQIPVESLDKVGIDKLTNNLKSIEQNQRSAIEQEIADLDNLTKKSKSLNNEIAKLLTNTTTIVLSREFELKRQEETGGKAYKDRKGILQLTKRGEYQKASWSFFGIALLMVVIFLFSDTLLEWAGLVSKINLIQNEIIKYIVWFGSKAAMLSPLIWLAMIQNKKMNQSKKLAEEYWHKEIVAKTFVGMSEQIDKNTEGDTAKNLRMKLLEITLDTISKNPADCIDNTNKSDHPINAILKHTGRKIDKANQLLTTANNVKDILKQ